MSEDEGFITVYTPKELAEDVFKYEKDLLDENIPFYWLEVNYHYAEEDILGFNPIFDGLQYSVGDRAVIVEASKKELSYFSKILTDAIGDKHTPEMQKVMLNYHNAVDRDLYNFVNVVKHGGILTPITIGYLSELQVTKISDCLPSALKFAPRCDIDVDTVRHILSRHGEQGKHDHCMGDINDIARMSYVFANFDKATFDGVYSSRFKCKDGSHAPHITLSKAINGTYYIIEAVTDAKAGKTHIVSAYIQR